MAPKDTGAQVGLTAPEDTKRGYGLWRGEVIHPADPRMDAILASGDPITDTKGLGLRYTPVRGSYAVQHFRVNDPDKFSAALDVAFPDVHDAVVRLVAEDIRERGFAALKDWCVSSALPEPFEVWEVRTEMRCEGYRPDICVRHPEGGQIELEVVNTHAPEAGRLDKAWGAGHIVLSLRIRDVVEKIVFSAGRGVVPEDDELRALLKGRRFTLCGRSEVSEEVRAVWRDLDFAAYARRLAAELDNAWIVTDGFLDSIESAVNRQPGKGPHYEAWARLLEAAQDPNQLLDLYGGHFLPSRKRLATDARKTAYDTFRVSGAEEKRQQARNFLAHFRVNEIRSRPLKVAIKTLWKSVRTTESGWKEARSWIRESYLWVYRNAVRKNAGDLFDSMANELTAVADAIVDDPSSRQCARVYKELTAEHADIIRAVSLGGDSFCVVHWQLNIRRYHRATADARRRALKCIYDLKESSSPAGLDKLKELR